MRKIIMLTALILSGLWAYAQDIIVTKDGEKIQAKVIEVNATNVTYKKFSKPDGSTYSIAKSDVKSITYQDTKETTQDAPIIIRHVSKDATSGVTGGRFTGYVIFGGGISFPSGEYSNTDAYDGKSGFANAGFNLHVDFAMPIAHSNFGLAACVGYNQHSINTSSFNAGYGMITKLDVDLISDPYQVAIFMGGLYVTIPVKRFAFDFKALAGASIFSLPRQSVYLYSAYTHESESSSVAEVNSAGFAYGGSFDVRYNVVKHFCFFAQISIVHSENDFTANYTYSNGNAPTTAAIKQPITLINPSFGIGIPF